MNRPQACPPKGGGQKIMGWKNLSCPRLLPVVGGKEGKEQQRRMVSTRAWGEGGGQVEYWGNTAGRYAVLVGIQIQARDPGQTASKLASNPPTSQATSESISSKHTRELYFSQVLLFQDKMLLYIYETQCDFWHMYTLWNHFLSLHIVIPWY